MYCLLSDRVSEMCKDTIKQEQLWAQHFPTTSIYDWIPFFLETVLFILFSLQRMHNDTLSTQREAQKPVIFFFSVKGLVGPPRGMLAEWIESGIVPSYRNKTFCFANIFWICDHI